MKKCDWCGDEFEGNGWGLNHNFCSLDCKRANDDVDWPN